MLELQMEAQTSNTKNCAIQRIFDFKHYNILI